MRMSDYVPIPVTEAKKIAITYSRDIVIICAWSHEHALLHTTTYGVAPNDKVSAANGGEICAKALGTELKAADVSEDFRKAHDAAREVAMAEAIEKHLPSLQTMAKQIGPRDDTFSTMVADFERAAKKTQP